MQIHLIGIFSLFVFNIISGVVNSQGTSEKPAKGDLTLVIKDAGVKELTSGDVALILYITVTNTGKDSLQLSINVTKCCQKFGSEEEEDCESMKPFGGDAGQLYPNDPRNFTAIYPTLYLHDRKGSCDVDIIAQNGKKMSRNVKFDTTLPSDTSSRLPRLLKDYYDPSQLSTCSEADQDPLNMCRPVSCLVKYTGYRNFYNHSSGACEKLPSCISKDKKNADQAYVPELNACYELKEKLTETELAEFTEGRPGIHALVHSHKYPMNIKCHYGTYDKETRSCDCDKGWASAPFDPASFNFDVQEYHMCTVWMGEMSAKEAANITVLPKGKHYHTTTIVFSILASIFVIVLITLIVAYFKQKHPKLPEAIASEENVRLMSLADESEDTHVDDEDDQL